MKRNFLKQVSLFLAFLILFMSCSQYEVTTTPIEEDVEPTFSSEYDLSTFDGFYREVAISAKNGYTGEDNLKAKTEYLVKYFNDRGIPMEEGDTEAIFAEMEKYSNYSFTEGIDLLLTEGKMTLVQKGILLPLNEKMERVETKGDYFANLEWLNDQVNSLAEGDDKLLLSAYYNLLKTDADVTVEIYGDDTARGACGSCVWKNKWKIFGWGFWFTLVITIVMCVAFVNAISTGSTGYAPGSIKNFLTLFGCPGMVILMTIETFQKICKRCRTECPGACW